MTSPNGYIIRVTGPLWGEFTSHQWISLTKPVTRCFEVFFDLRLGKQSRRWWFETPSRSAWRHWNYDNCHARRLHLNIYHSTITLSTRLRLLTASTFAMVVDGCVSLQCFGQQLSSGTWKIVMEWKNIWHCWAFVRRIFQSPIDSPHKGPIMLMFSLLLTLKSCSTSNRVACDFGRNDTHVISMVTYLHRNHLQYSLSLVVISGTTYLSSTFSKMYW